MVNDPGWGEVEVKDRGKVDKVVKADRVVKADGAVKADLLLPVPAEIVFVNSAAAKNLITLLSRVIKKSARNAVHK